MLDYNLRKTLQQGSGNREDKTLKANQTCGLLFKISTHICRLRLDTCCPEGHNDGSKKEDGHLSKVPQIMKNLACSRIKHLR